MKLSIIHISDTHVSESKIKNLDKVIKLLIKDIKLLCSTREVDDIIICFSGDLINKDKDIEYDLALEHIIIPLLESLKLSVESLYIVAGNHDVNIKRIDQYTEKGIRDDLCDSDKIEKFIDNLDGQPVSRIEDFNDFSSIFSGKPIYETKLSKCYIRKKDTYSIGIACMNSAWRSRGEGPSEKNSLILGKRQVMDCYDVIKDTDIRIGMFHHPTDWLLDIDKFEVDRCLNEYDIILNGHIHTLKTEFITGFNGKCLFNTTGKLDLTSDIFNGYSMLTIDLVNKDCEVILRKYYEPKDKFDYAIDLIDNGIFNQKISKRLTADIIACDIVYSISHKFNKYIDSFLVPNVLDGSNKSFSEVFVEPILNEKSEYEKENVDVDSKENGYISISTIISCENNIILMGRRESGKTTLLHYLTVHYINQFKTLRQVPVIINANQKFNRVSNIVSEVKRSISSFFNETFSIDLSAIKNLLESGYMVVMFDNCEDESIVYNETINRFIESYNKNKYIFACNEAPTKYFNNIKGDIIKDDSIKFIYLRGLEKHQVRTLTESFIGNNIEDETTPKIENLLKCLRHTNLPRTPFIVSLVLSIAKTNNNYIPVNEAIVVENFIEILLEKLNNKKDDSNYDYYNKIHFLTHISVIMCNNNKFYFNEAEFDSILRNYHNELGYNIQETKFDTIFYEQGILYKYCNEISFRYSCFIEYFLAKHASNNIDFYNNMISKDNYLNYCNEINYYTGLNREDTNVLSTIKKYLIELAKPILENVDKKIDINIDNKIFSIDELKSNIITALSLEETDQITNVPDESITISTSMMKKENEKTNELDNFLRSLLLFGVIIKNSDALDYQTKKENFSIYMNTMILFSFLFIQSTQKFYDEVKDEIAKENQEEIFNNIINTIKTIIPISIQNTIRDNIGTLKLDRIISVVMEEESDNNSIDKFFLVSLYCDLRLSNYSSILEKYIKSIESKDILHMMLLKLIYYYRYRYFSSRYNQVLENLIHHIYKKLWGSNVKKHIEILKKSMLS